MWKTNLMQYIAVLICTNNTTEGEGFRSVPSFSSSNDSTISLFPFEAASISS